MRVKVTPERAMSIYYLHPLLAGQVGAWAPHCERARSIGFSHLCAGPIFAPLAGGSIFLADDPEKANPTLEAGSDADNAAKVIATSCATAGLGLLLDVVLDRVAAGGHMSRSASHWFYRKAASDVVDPRQEQIGPDALLAHFEDPAREMEITAWWTDRLIRLCQAGVHGFRLLGVGDVPARFVRSVVAGVRAENSACRFTAWTPGVSWQRLAELQTAGLDAVFGSTAWWDGRAGWFTEEHNTLRRVAPQIVGVAESPFEERLAARSPSPEQSQAISRRVLRIAAATGQGLLVPMGFEFGARRKMDPRNARPADFEQDRAPFDLSEDIAAANALTERISARGPAGEMRKLSSPGDAMSMLLQVDGPDARHAGTGLLVAINTEDTPQPLFVPDALPPSAGGAFGDAQPLEPGDQSKALDAGEVRIMTVTRQKPIAQRAPRNGLAAALKSPRVAIERVSPSVEGGDFAVKRIVGEPVTVEADIFTDGHDRVAAELLWRTADETEWQRAPMLELGNDRWQATFLPRRIGRHMLAVGGWRDDYGSLCHEIEVKYEAKVDITLELTEARHFLEHLHARSVPCNTTALSKAIKTLENGKPDEGLQAFTAPTTAKAVAASGERPFEARSQPIMLDVERPQAAFASWYELFPRSQSGDPARHGTFSDVIARLPDIRQMGFDVLYFPPIHPIGRKNRKGRNNTLTPTPDDPGSPYAIGSEEGGHDKIHPELGTLADFRKLVASAKENGMEIALDFAIQCAPDHPWLREHPDWFRWRPDGTVKYAENPPKKYQDIVNVDFYGGDQPGLWAAIARRRSVLGRRGRAHRSRRQSAHQAVAVLALDDRGGPRALSRCHLSVRSVHTSEGDVPARQGRLLAVLQLLHLAQYETGADRISHRTDHHRGEGVLPAELLRQYAGHQSLFPADVGTPGLPDPRGAGGNALRPLGGLFGI